MPRPPRRLSPAYDPVIQTPPLREGYCRLCRVIRLSCEDVGGICDGCRYDFKQVSLYFTEREVTVWTPEG